MLRIDFMQPEQTTTPAMQTPSAATKVAGSPFAIPGAILIGFAMIAAAIFFSGAAGTSNKAANLPLNTGGADTTTEAIRPIDATDHVRGNPNAQIVFVEYSDFDCPFCKRFHEDTMAKLMSEYGSDGRVAWVYRHFPLEQLHPNATKIAEASECVAELAGNDAFWKFSDLVFGEREINAQTDMTKLADYAAQAGAEKAAFTTCLNEGRHADKVAADLADGMAAGVKGTPHTFVIVGGQQGVINGAQPYETVKKLTDNLIAQLEGAAE
jgi:protein-disulfide isomerase